VSRSMVIPTMEAAAPILRPQTRGTALLIHHCLTIDGPSAPRLPARERLELAIGDELARLLVTALVPAAQGRRGSSSP
jgi:hypothetical protein